MHRAGAWLWPVNFGRTHPHSHAIQPDTKPSRNSSSGPILLFISRIQGYYLKEATTLIFFAAFACFLGLADFAHASGKIRGITVTTTRELAFPEGGSIAEFDSLNRFYVQKVIKTIDGILDYRIVHRWSEHNNKDFVEIMEVRDWGVVEVLGGLIKEALGKAIPDRDERGRYKKALDRYFETKHSQDDISEARDTVN